MIKFPDAPITLSLDKINSDGTALFEPIHIDESCANGLISIEDLWSAQYLVAYRVEDDTDIETVPKVIITYIEAVLADGRLYKIDPNQCNVGRMELRLEERIDWDSYEQEKQNQTMEDKYEEE